MFLSQQPSCPTLLKFLVSSPFESAAEFVVLHLMDEALYDFTLPYFFDFVTEHVALTLFIKILSALKALFSAMLTKDCYLFFAHHSSYILLSTCSEIVIMLKTILKT